jgi:AraC-like DNA-binding protein
LLELARIYTRTDRASEPGTLPAAKIREYERAVNKNFKTLRTVADYAPLLHVTPNYLNAACKKITGKAAGEIIRDRTLLEAKRLLANTDSSVAEIAYQLQFEDNSYFGRFFKKYTGMTPAKFRERQHALTTKKQAS